MIEFGLFSSNIPYVIFIAIYMLYFGASTLNKQDRGDAALQERVSESRIAPDHRQTNTTVYRVGYNIRIIADKGIITTNNIPEYPVRDIPYSRADIPAVKTFFSNSVFSRPPPFSA